MDNWPPGPGDPAAFFAMNGPPGPPGAGPPPAPPIAPPPPPGTPGFRLDPLPSGAAPRVRRGDVRAAALALLAEGPRNGYQIIQEITERSHGIWRPSPGSVYPALQQLEDEGLVRAEEEGGRRAYRLTDLGRAHVADNREALAEPWAAVADSVTEEMVDLRSLFGQVGMALRQVAEAGTHAQHEHARRILAETRRSLYRLLAEDPEGDD
jgi:DNA-binding PadR family transcriptional regulator